MPRLCLCNKRNLGAEKNTKNSITVIKSNFLKGNCPGVRNVGPNFGSNSDEQIPFEPYGTRRIKRTEKAKCSMLSNKNLQKALNVQYGALQKRVEKSRVLQNDTKDKFY